MTMLLRSTPILLVVLVLASAYVAAAQTAEALFESGRYAAAARAYEADAATSPDAFLGAAKSYTALRDWDRAVDAYEKYRDEAGAADRAEVDAVIALLKAPDEEVFVENLGEPVNSSYEEGSPRVSADGRRLYFKGTDRPGGLGGEDIWYAERTAEGSWGAPKNLGSPINTESHEALHTMSADGNVAVLFGNYEGRFGGGDFFYSARNGTSWTVPCNLGAGINTDEWESMGALAPDGKTFMFVVYAGRGDGEDVGYLTDIYISHLQNGAWTPPKPLPAPVNTPGGDELRPFLNVDGRTLYFASDGHPGLGGRDLFVTRRIGDGWDQWSQPVNLGKSINTVLHDENLAIPASGTVAYFNRMTTGEGDDGFGDLDIYRMTLPPSMRPEPVVAVSGIVTDERDSTAAATLRWSDFDTGEKLGVATSSAGDGSYYHVLRNGRRYLVTVDQKGFLFQTETLDLREGSTGYQEVELDLQLTRAAEGARIVLRNIYFDTGSAELLDDSQHELDRLVEIMANSDLEIEIGGHTDDTGSAGGNQRLSQRRAESVRSYLLDHDIDADRVTAHGYGEEMPIASNDEEEGRAQNRRVEIKITGMASGREGRGELVEQEDQTVPEPVAEVDEDFYELYRQAALAGGVPDGAECYDRSFAFRTASGAVPGGRTRTPAAALATRNAIGSFNLFYVSHGAGGLHGNITESAGGMAIVRGSEEGESNLYGYFLGGVYGGGMEYINYVGLQNLVSLPMTVDAGFGLHGVMQSSEVTALGVTTDFVNVSLGATIPLRLRYNLDLGPARVSPYAGYTYNLLSLVDIDVDPNQDRVVSIDSPSFTEFGVSARVSVISAGIAWQGDATTLRVGLATGGR